MQVYAWQEKAVICRKELANTEKMVHPPSNLPLPFSPPPQCFPSSLLIHGCNLPIKCSLDHLLHGQVYQASKTLTHPAYKIWYLFFFFCTVHGTKNWHHTTSLKGWSKLSKDKRKDLLSKIHLYFLLCQIRHDWSSVRFVQQELGGLIFRIKGLHWWKKLSPASPYLPCSVTLRFPNSYKRVGRIVCEGEEKAVMMPEMERFFNNISPASDGGLGGLSAYKGMTKLEVSIFSFF